MPLAEAMPGPPQMIPPSTPSLTEVYQHSQNQQHDSSINTLIQQCGLINILTLHHAHTPPLATYSRGTKCLDYILMTPHTSQCAIHSGILPFNTFFFCDHRPVYINFNSKRLFHGPTFKIPPPKESFPYSMRSLNCQQVPLLP